ncbi:hypothetical protein [Chitiniphilus eburneus]|uniref:Uncharacterized protein n=1 Tax=Chitiniphilus eburneus TaxID=2571148 RepID=A0A4U0PZ05_9NEIS|nr:hypothetical protein [Chitiniphilus eburneus]TJZ73891.1 hypothetical protein FAZ21_09755 [Chitiniphilus eburneus]
MKYLASRNHTIAIDVVKGKEDFEVVAYAKEIGSKNYFEIENSRSFGFDDFYKKIGCFFNRESLLGEKYPFGILLAHIEQYKNNLYGFLVLADSGVSVDYVLAVQESYVQYFSLEMASYFSTMDESDIVVFSKKIEDLICVNEDRSNALGLKCFYERWKLISTPRAMT